MASLDNNRNFQIIQNIVLCTALVMAVLGAQGYNRGDAANSRLATVYSLNKYGTWYIDRPEGEPPIPFERRTIDKVVVNGRLLSSKPPMLPLLMATEAYLLKKTIGWDLDDPADLNKIVRVMTMTLIGFAYVAALVLFASTLRLLVFDPLTQTLLIFNLAFCTQLWGYATIINNHVPGASMVVVALSLALGVGTGRRKPDAWRFFAFGVAAGLVPTLDMPATIFVAFAGIWLLVKHPKQTLIWAVLGAAIPLAIHCGIMYQVTGSILPVQMRSELYLSEASYWRSPRGIDALNEPKGVYLFHMTLGRCGLFSLYPILLVGVAATARALMKRPPIPYRNHILCGAGAFLILTAYYVLKTNNYAGEAYGFRWYIVTMPVLLLMGAPILATMRVRWKWLFVGLMMGISFYSASQCAKSPWGANREWTCQLFLGPSYGPMPYQNK
ncbi:MAG: hypothetical protein GWP08_16025 [Nitrospiraceae bacterium]|nr:hypothetical protein [Nitrospiraceae bacterium]